MEKVFQQSLLQLEEETEPPSSLNIIKNKTIKIKQAEPELRQGSFFIEKNISKNRIPISYKINKNNFKIKIFDNFEFSIDYPQGTFSELNKETKKILVDNFIYTKTAPLAILAAHPMYYQTAMPFLKNFVDQGVIKDLPRLSLLTKIELKDLLENFVDLPGEQKINFKNGYLFDKLLPVPKTSNEKVILALSFGKESLLSYGLIKELGLKCHLVFINDMEKYNQNELKLKKKIIKEFSQEQNEKIFSLKDDTDNIFRLDKISKENPENIEKLDMTNAMLAFTLELTPLVYFHRAKYIIFGNEMDYNHYFLDKDKSRVYHAYDQSSTYVKEKNQRLNQFAKNIEVLSLVKPLYNLAEMKILYSRYPHLLKYIMSCSSDYITNEKWCGRCSTCAEMFLYSAAVGDPQKIGFKNNLFEGKYKEFYPLFFDDMSFSEIYEIYRVPPLARDEQLLAFLLAFRNGWQGELIDLFKSLYLKEAEKREEELKKKFFGIHSINNIPEKLRDKVLNIYREALKDFLTI